MRNVAIVVSIAVVATIAVTAAILRTGGRNATSETGHTDSTILNVTAEQLYLEYRDGNPAQADAKYQGKVLRVSGRVLAVEQNVDGYILGLETGPNVVASGVELRAAVVAPFPRSQQSTLAKMKLFDDVVVVGECLGKTTARGRMGGIQITIANAHVDQYSPRK